MKRRLTGAQARDEWQRLLRLQTLDASRSETTDPDDDNEEEDPFDCSDLFIPPTWKQVDDVAQTYLRKWEQLDHRKIVEDSTTTDRSIQRKRQVRFAKDTNNNSDDSDTDSVEESNSQAAPDRSNKKRTYRGGWRDVENRLRLPYNFDYATIGPEPQDDGQGPRVLELPTAGTDETTTASYERELWKLFASVPKAKAIQEETWKGAQLKHIQAVQQEIAKGPPASDGHLLSRLRMNDRHGLPPIHWPTHQHTTKGSSISMQKLPDTLTLRLECWRRQPRRQSSPDPNRAALEFLGEQTLLDLHTTLMQLHDDHLWDKDPPIKSKNLELSAGCFFIENTFYEHGNKGYARPIIDWMDGGRNKAPHAARRGFIGITTMEPLTIQEMKNVRLQDIPMRLGYRYYHVCHGDVETAIFLVDRRWTHRALEQPYPILHDIWTMPFPIPICEACQTQSAILMTSRDCPHTTTTSPAGTTVIPGKEAGIPLCGACADELGIPDEQRRLYSTWRREGELSTSLARDSTKLF